MSRRARVGGDYLVSRTAPDEVVCPEDMGEAERLLMRTIQEFADREVTPAADEIDRRQLDGWHGVGAMRRKTPDASLQRTPR